MLKIGIIGLPNAGKSTLFNALAKTHVPCESYPFCTIEPNVGVVSVPDNRLHKISEIYQSKRIVPAAIEFVDIAGLVKGASQGEGLGNKFLSHIRQVAAIVHVIRLFTDENIAHVQGAISPQDDREIVDFELLLSDTEVIQNRVTKLERLKQTGDKEAVKELKSLAELLAILEEGLPLREKTFDDETSGLIKELGLLSSKPVLYVLNLDEETLSNADLICREFKSKIGRKSTVLALCAKIESEIGDLEAQEAALFYNELGLSESGLVRLIREGYTLLDLVTFFTTESNEAKAWAIHNGAPLAKTAGKIHTDMEKGFIKAEVITYTDLLATGTPHGVREAGLVRIEGKEHPVHDGDIVLFKFSS